MLSRGPLADWHSRSRDGAAIQALQIRSTAAAPTRTPPHRCGTRWWWWCAGPVGLSLAIDLALRGRSVASACCCWTTTTASLDRLARHLLRQATLEIWDRLGVGDAMCAKGRGLERRQGLQPGPDLLYRFDLLPEPGHERPAFINLQQYYAEAWLVLRAQRAAQPGDPLAPRPSPACEPRRRRAPGHRHARRPYTVDAGVAACDGSRSPLRSCSAWETRAACSDRFLIADVHGGRLPGPAERWFWFDPPFHPNQSVLLHRQPDGVWRIDFQLGWDADPKAEKARTHPPRVTAMLRSALGPRGAVRAGLGQRLHLRLPARMDRFRHGRVLFASDSAHGVSPFGARGNSGVQDAISACLEARPGAARPGAGAPSDTYPERWFAADETS